MDPHGSTGIPAPLPIRLSPPPPAGPARLEIETTELKADNVPSATSCRLLIRRHVESVDRTAGAVCVRFPAPSIGLPCLLRQTRPEEDAGRAGRRRLRLVGMYTGMATAPGWWGCGVVVWLGLAWLVGI